MNADKLGEYVADAIEIVKLNFSDDIIQKYGFVEGFHFADGFGDDARGIELETEEGSCVIHQNEIYSEMPASAEDNFFTTDTQVVTSIVRDLLAELPEWIFDASKMALEAAFVQEAMDKGLSIKDILSQLKAAIEFYSMSQWSCPTQDDECVLEKEDSTALAKILGEHTWKCNHDLSLTITPYSSYFKGACGDEELNNGKWAFLQVLTSLTASLPEWYFADSVSPNLSIACLTEIDEIINGPEERDDDEEDEEEDEEDQNDDPFDYAVADELAGELSYDSVRSLVNDAYKNSPELCSKYLDIIQTIELAYQKLDAIDRVEEPGECSDIISATETYVSPFTGKKV